MTVPVGADLAELHTAHGDGLADQFQHSLDGVFMLHGQKLRGALRHRVEQGVVLAQSAFRRLAHHQFLLQVPIGVFQLYRALGHRAFELSLVQRQLRDALLGARRFAFGVRALPQGPHQQPGQHQESDTDHGHAGGTQRRPLLPCFQRVHPG